MDQSLGSDKVRSKNATAATAVNAAVFADVSDSDFLLDMLKCIPNADRALIISKSPVFLRGATPFKRLNSAEIGLDQGQVTTEEVMGVLRQEASSSSKGMCVVVDMDWVSHLVHGAAKIEAWGETAAQIAERLGMGVVSVYKRELMVDELLQLALRVHRQFAAPSGIYENPFWVPPSLVRASMGEQISFILGRVVPDYAGQEFFERDDRFAARGADPDWLVHSRSIPIAQKQSGSWQIFCLGPLRVQRNSKERINWRIRGGAPKKTKTLFAYLLTQGERGAHIDRIAELLWPQSGTEKRKRARLHHTVAILRKTLGTSDSILRTGDFYRLNPPDGSWIDIDSFEQLCRRGLSLFKRGQREEAQLIYSTAEKLYTGDMFEDIPLEYVETEQEDWCIPRRIWLRDMALKLQRDFSVLLREQGHLRAALEHCQKALAIEPTNEDANIEIMQVFHAQGRADTVARQYRRYKKAMETISSTHEGSEVQEIYYSLMKR